MCDYCDNRRYHCFRDTIFPLVTKITTSGVYCGYLRHQSYPVSKFLERKLYLSQSSWDVVQLMAVVVYRCFSTACRSHLQGSDNLYCVTSKKSEILKHKVTLCTKIPNFVLFTRSRQKCPVLRTFPNLFRTCIVE